VWSAESAIASLQRAQQPGVGEAAFGTKCAGRGSGLRGLLWRDGRGGGAARANELESPASRPGGETRSGAADTTLVTIDGLLLAAEGALLAVGTVVRDDGGTIGRACAVGPFAPGNGVKVDRVFGVVVAAALRGVGRRREEGPCGLDLVR